MGLNREGTTQSGGGGLIRRERIRGDGLSCQMKTLQRGGGRTILVKWRTLLREGLIKGNVS